MIPAFKPQGRQRHGQGTRKQKQKEDVRRPREIDCLEGVATIEVPA
jgi:hypothetical protein